MSLVPYLNGCAAKGHEMEHDDREMSDTQGRPRSSRWRGMRAILGLCTVTAANCDAIADSVDPTADTGWLAPGLVYDGAVLNNLRGGVRPRDARSPDHGRQAV